MAKKEKPIEEAQGLQVWKVIGMFAMVFLAVQLSVAAFGVGMNFLMQQLGAGDNLRVFFSSTVSRVGMIVSTILITAPVVRVALKKHARTILYPFDRTWLKDLLAGLGIAAAAMTAVFLIELAFGWLEIEGLSLSGEPADAWLRAFWLAILVNTATAVGEEVLFRGFLVTGLKEAWDKRGAVFVSAVIFGASHILISGASQTNWLEFIPLLALPGVMLGWAYLRSGNLWLATGIHFAWNLFQNDIFNLAGRTGGETLIGLDTNLKGPQWILGTSYGIEVGLIGIIGLLIAIAGIWLYTRKKKAG